MTRAEFDSLVGRVVALERAKLIEALAPNRSRAAYMREYRRKTKAVS